MPSPVEIWKSEKHGFDVWPDVLRYSKDRTAMDAIPAADLERMKWHGVFYRKRDEPGTYMLRIRLTANELTAKQARTIAFIAYEYGYGIADLTTRANIQVQGLAIEHVPRAIERLNSTGLNIKQTGHDNVRTVFGHPFAGLDPEELIDTRPCCRAITEVFLDSRVYSDLPRKFNIALCGQPAAGLHYWTQDIGLLAFRGTGGQVLFHLLIAGKQGKDPRLGQPLPIAIRPEDAPQITHLLLDLFRKQGSREKRDESRFCHLVDRIGIDGVTAHLREHSDCPLFTADEPPAMPTGYDDEVGWFPQRQADRWIMGLCVPLGRLTWEQLESLAVVSTKWGDGTLRTTPSQGIVVPNIPSAFRDAAATDAARFGLSVHGDTLARNFVACTGKQFCNIAVTETKGHAYQLIERLRQRALTLHGIRVHMSGCPSSCGMHHTADIGLKGVRVKRLLGSKEGFDVFLGGGLAGSVRLGMLYKLGVDVDQVPQLIEEVVRDYYVHHRDGETFSAYWREKLRNEQAGKAGEEEYLPLVWECENCGHHHPGEDPPVFCPKCAGLRRCFVRLDGEASVIGTVTPAKENASHDPSTIPPVPDANGFVVVAEEHAIVEGRGLAVQAAGQDLALFRVGGQIRAVQGICPHEGGSLSEGTIDAAGAVTCPLHQWRFDLVTGKGLDPPDCALQCFPVKVENGRVAVQCSATEDARV